MQVTRIPKVPVKSAGTPGMSFVTRRLPLGTVTVAESSSESVSSLSAVAVFTVTPAAAVVE